MRISKDVQLHPGKGGKDGGGRGRTYLSDSEVEWGRVGAGLGTSSDESTIAVAKSVSECKSREGRTYSYKEDTTTIERETKAGIRGPFVCLLNKWTVPAPAQPHPFHPLAGIGWTWTRSPLDSQFFSGEAVRFQACRVRLFSTVASVEQAQDVVQEYK